MRSKERIYAPRWRDTARGFVLSGQRVSAEGTRGSVGGLGRDDDGSAVLVAAAGNLRH